MPAAPGSKRSAIRSSPLSPLTVRVPFETDADVAAAAGPAVARPAATIAAAAPAASPSRRTPSLLSMISSSHVRLPTLVSAHRVGVRTQEFLRFSEVSGDFQVITARHEE